MRIYCIICRENANNNKNMKDMKGQKAVHVKEMNSSFAKWFLLKEEFMFSCWSSHWKSAWHQNLLSPLRLSFRSIHCSLIDFIWSQFVCHCFWNIPISPNPGISHSSRSAKEKNTKFHEDNTFVSLSGTDHGVLAVGWQLHTLPFQAGVCCSYNVRFRSR